MFDEDDLLPISALAHLFFCERRAALIHIEGLWDENLFTAEGRNLHERAHEPAFESRGDLRIARGLRLRSLRLGLSGIADVVEFHRVDSNEVPCHSDPALAGEESRTDSQTQTSFLTQTTPNGQSEIPPLRFAQSRNDSEGLGMTEAGVKQGSVLEAGVSLPGARGLWQPFPVEYKRGRLRREEGYEVQLCAQALCLEEMLRVAVPLGAVFYGQPRKRLEVVFGEELRQETETAAARLHELTRIGRTPLATYEKKCESCSLLTLCMPKTTGGRKSVDRYLDGMLEYGGG